MSIWCSVWWIGSVSSVAQSCLTLCDPMDCSTPGFPVHHQLPEFAQTHVHRVGDAIQPSHPLSSPLPPTLNLSQHRSLFKWVSSLQQVAKVLQFQLQYLFFFFAILFYFIFLFFLNFILFLKFKKLSSCNEYSGLISFRIDWFDLLAVQGTLKSFLQHHSSKASIILH